MLEPASIDFLLPFDFILLDALFFRLTLKTFSVPPASLPPYRWLAPRAVGLRAAIITSTVHYQKLPLLLMTRMRECCKTETHR